MTKILKMLPAYSLLKPMRGGHAASYPGAIHPKEGRIRVLAG